MEFCSSLAWARLVPQINAPHAELEAEAFVLPKVMHKLQRKGACVTKFWVVFLNPMVHPTTPSDSASRLAHLEEGQTKHHRRCIILA